MDIQATCSVLLALKACVQETAGETVLKRQTGEAHLGVPQAARPLCMNIILQDALTNVVQRFSQPGFPVKQFIKRHSLIISRLQRLFSVILRRG